MLFLARKLQSSEVLESWVPRLAASRPIALSWGAPRVHPQVDDSRLLAVREPEPELKLLRQLQPSLKRH